MPVPNSRVRLRRVYFQPGRAECPYHPANTAGSNMEGYRYVRAPLAASILRVGERHPSPGPSREAPHSHSSNSLVMDAQSHPAKLGPGRSRLELGGRIRFVSRLTYAEPARECENIGAVASTDQPDIRSDQPDIRSDGMRRRSGHRAYDMHIRTSRLNGGRVPFDSLLFGL